MLLSHFVILRIWSVLFSQLPVVMRVPRFSAWAQNLCGMQFSILGYGDIIVPGEVKVSSVFTYNIAGKYFQYRQQWLLSASQFDHTEPTVVGGRRRKNTEHMVWINEV